MTIRVASGFLLAAVLAVPFGALAETPEECLALDANSKVASCADRYAPRSTSPRTRSEPQSTSPRTPLEPQPTPPRARQAAGGGSPDLKSVPVVPQVTRVAKVEPGPERSGILSVFDRISFNDPFVVGVLGASFLAILIMFVIWRSGTSLSKSCRWCGAKLSTSARTCRRCFRAV